MPEFRRRDLLFGLAGGASMFASRRARAATRFTPGDPPPSPRTTPFVAPLPVPPVASTVNAFKPDATLPTQSDLSRLRFYRLVTEERLVRLHPQLPPTRIWSYRDANVAPGAFPFAAGPTIVARSRDPHIVRHENQLPRDHVGFGDPRTTVHLHGGHHDARSDGFPEDIPGFPAVIQPGASRDYSYPLLDPGFSTGEADASDRPSTMWYHDHLLDFTGPNVYRGLAGFFLYFDELDSGSELTGLRLPSGAFDVPLLFQDKRLDRNGQLVYDGLLDHDGFLGDKFLVNGAIQPVLTVKRRKYRFRCLNAANARFLALFFAGEDGRVHPFDLIATEGGLLDRTQRGQTQLLLTPAQRLEVVFDFTRFRGGTVLYVENRWSQPDGRGPEGTLAQPRLRASDRFLKIVVGGPAADPSQVPDVLRPFEQPRAAEVANARRRRFEFERRHGTWVINGRGVDLEEPLATVRRNEPEVWTLKNGGGGWWHPVHVHLEFMHVLTRNGLEPADADERVDLAKRDIVTLGPGDELDVFFKFRDFAGPYVFHCHNLEHEDVFMMGRFDVV